MIYHVSFAFEVSAKYIIHVYTMNNCDSFGQMRRIPYKIVLCLFIRADKTNQLPLENYDIVLHVVKALFCM